MHAIQMEEVTYATRTLATPRRVRFDRSHDAQHAAPLREMPEWQREALQEFEESLQPLEVRLRRDLASRIMMLTGHRITPDTIYADPMNQVAVTTVDGIVFKLIRQNLVILRSCVQCGCCQFMSMPITNRAELGYVLSEWEPRCASCQAEDPDYWIYTN
ncbi:MAG: hypothetical protein QOH93_2406 [Chloroflexia bacterium]|nr:hypothetical protein [Chloroflexia bacterium]